MKKSIKKQLIACIPEKLGESVFELNSDNLKPNTLKTNHIHLSCEILRLLGFSMSLNQSTSSAARPTNPSSIRLSGIVECVTFHNVENGWSELKFLPFNEPHKPATVHKFQLSRFSVVIIPVTTQHFKMRVRNLIYTGLTRAKQLCVFVGSRKALAKAIRQIDNRKWQMALTQLTDRGKFQDSVSIGNPMRNAK